ncbi:MAG: 16S rRNA (guanine(527)-N(7))-methyltransferase RsmG [Bacillota bacterium]|nr:16S rRNA (guanine(527)-N(7))-methyltransferase RsmG [Bacillota bacterium]
MKEILRSTGERAGIRLDDLAWARLARHWELVQEANSKFNLTAITEREQAVEKHYLDSLLALELLDSLPGEICDLGSGGGFPGLVLAIARPERPITLVEATEKKCVFLEECAAELGLSQLQVVNARAEEAGRDPALRERFPLVTARALAALNVLCEYGLPLLAEGGTLLAYKGAGWEEEVAAAANALDLLNAGLGESRLYQLPGGDQRCLLRVEKRGPCPEKYPRRPGMPTKRPL